MSGRVLSEEENNYFDYVAKVAKAFDVSVEEIKKRMTSGYAIAPEGYYKDGKPVITSFSIVPAQNSVWGKSILEALLPHIVQQAKMVGLIDNEKDAPDH